MTEPIGPNFAHVILRRALSPLSADEFGCWVGWVASETSLLHRLMNVAIPEYLRQNYKQLKPQVYVVPENLDKDIARLKLASMGHSLDKLTRRAGTLSGFLARRHVNRTDIPVLSFLV